MRRHAGRAGRLGEVAVAVARQELLAERVLKREPDKVGQPGDPLYAERDRPLQRTWFALSRLEWLTDDAPSSSAGGAFRLVFDSGPRLSVNDELRLSVSAMEGERLSPQFGGRAR